MMKKNKYVLTDAQKNCQDALDTCNNCIIIKSIRSGKTLTILDYIIKNKYKKILWITPYLTNLEGLKDEIEKWNFKVGVTSTTYNSIKHFENKVFDLIVIDECHRITKDSLQHLQTIKYSKLVCMTGTYPKNKDKVEILENNLNCKVVFKYSIKDAVADKNVAPYNITIVEKELSTENNVLVDTKNHKFYTSELKSYNYLISKISSEFSKQKRMLLTFNMMRFLNTLDSTVVYIKNYLKENSNKRILVFVATQEMAEKCSKYCYYGGGKSDEYYKLFREGKIDHLILVEKAAIGVTYENLDGCLLTTINSSNSSVLQKIFRTVLFRPNYTADIKILINKNTKQVEWIKTALDES